MKTTDLVKYAGALAALALGSACSSGSAIAPSKAVLDGEYLNRTTSVNGRLVTLARPNLSGLPRYPATVPDRTARSKAKFFEYIINVYGSYASIFDYPKSTKQIGTIDDVGGQGCTNVLHGYGKSTFWIVAGSDQITEYRVPQTPIKTLSIPGGSMPSSCAMNKDGDLAVGILFGSAGGNVVIYKNAGGRGTFIKTPLAREFFDGYDNKGNLFLDGFTNASAFELVEIPKGSNRARAIATSNTVQFPGSVQWDGTHLTIFDQFPNKLYRYDIEGTKAVLKGTVSFFGSTDCAQTWIANDVVYCADAGNDNGEVFNYPAGGAPIAVFTGKFDEPLGTVAVKR
ncbi:MAG TPA: hypothetical protein VGF86_01380 [Candidatus Tumulicola sp.]|jgi:hypothetical protein